MFYFWTKDAIVVSLVLCAGITYQIPDGLIGVTTHWFTGRVSRVHKNTPAEAAGILVGDKILNYSKITGPSGTTVVLHIKRENQIIDIEVERAILPDDYAKE